MRIQPIALALVCLISPPTQAETLRMLSVGAVKNIVEPTAADFFKMTGHVVSILTGTAGETEKRVTDGEACDVVALPVQRLEGLAKTSKIDLGSKRDLGTIRIGVGVRDGEPKPDISTLAAFKAALRATPRLVYSNPSSGASSGIHFAKMVTQMGMEAELAPKTIFRNGGTAVMDAVSAKEGDLGITQISEILPVKGVYVVGPLPAEIQNATTYSIAVCNNTKSEALGRAFIDVLRSDQAKARFRKQGFETQ